MPLLLKVESGLNPHFGNPFPLDLVCASVRKIFFRIILTFLGGYFKYLRALSWSEVLEVGAVVFWKRKGNLILCAWKLLIKCSKTEFAFYWCIKLAMILRFLTLGNTEKLELDLFYSGAGEWHEHAKAEAPLIPFAGCSLQELCALIAHLPKIRITDHFSRSVFGHHTFLPLRVAVSPGDETHRARGWAGISARLPSPPPARSGAASAVGGSPLLGRAWTPKREDGVSISTFSWLSPPPAAATQGSASWGWGAAVGMFAAWGGGVTTLRGGPRDEAAGTEQSTWCFTTTGTLRAFFSAVGKKKAKTIRSRQQLSGEGKTDQSHLHQGQRGFHTTWLYRSSLPSDRLIKLIW